jgi:hypothetical protein
MSSSCTEGLLKVEADGGLVVGDESDSSAEGIFPMSGGSSGKPFIVGAACSRPRLYIRSKSSLGDLFSRTVGSLFNESLETSAEEQWMLLISEADMSRTDASRTASGTNTPSKPPLRLAEDACGSGGVGGVDGGAVGRVLPLKSAAPSCDDVDDRIASAEADKGKQLLGVGGETRAPSSLLGELGDGGTFARVTTAFNTATFGLDAAAVAATGDDVGNSPGIPLEVVAECALEPPDPWSILLAVPAGDFVSSAETCRTCFPLLRRVAVRLGSKSGWQTKHFPPIH